MKYILITGASSGIGRCLTDYFANSGKYTVLACDINKEELKLMRSKNIITYVMDVTSNKSIEEAYNKICKVTNNISVIINNAGINKMTSLIESDTDIIQSVMDINLFGMIRVNKIMFPLLNKTSRIINMSSECGWMSPSPFNGPYIISKYALEAYNDTLRRELRFLGIKVIKIQPGAFKTNMQNNVLDSIKKAKKESILYKKVFDNLEKSAIKALEEVSNMSYLILAIEDAIESDSPKICYRVKNSRSRKFMNMFSEKTIDSIFYKHLK
ncbi:MAG: SDR family NAD(P)-dependent oxidoreductase [Bacilli bacterium]